MNRFILIFICLFTFLSSGWTRDARPDSLKNSNEPVYKKLFKDKSKLHSKKGFITVHRYEDKLYFEMPLMLLGRDFLMRSVISRSTDLEYIGMQGGSQKYITIERTDSLVLYRELKSNMVPRKDDLSQQHAISQSKANPVVRTFPIKGYTRDSLNVIYDVTDFYKSTNKEILDLKGLSYSSPLIRISTYTPNSKASFLNNIYAYESSVMVQNTVSATLGLNLLGLLPLPLKPQLSMELSTYLVLLNQKKMPVRMANQNVGTGVVSFYDYRPLVDTKWKQYVTRRRHEKGKEMIFYIDTLITSDWHKAIAEAAEEWNKTFDAHGFGKPLRIMPYPKDSGFSHYDPRYNIILLTPAAGSMSVDNIIDPRTGEILSSRIIISQDAVRYIRKQGMLQLSAVDKRFRTYFVPDDAIYEGICALALTAFGRTLGLTTNYAGSYAYTPEQIRSAEFTQMNGFTASVMDNILYNNLAQPGDMEKGVKLVIDRVGIADAFAIQYLYGNFGTEEQEEEALKRFVRKHEKDPRFLYIGKPSTFPSDPRGQSDDLGNDPIVYLHNRTNNLKILTDHADQWFDAEHTPENFRKTIPNLVVDEYYSSITSPLFSYIGGFYVNETNQYSSLPPYSAVDKALQRKVVKALIDACDKIDWLNDNRTFLYMAGMNTDIEEYICNRGLPVGPLVQRLQQLSFYAKKTENPYTPAEYLSDIEDYLFKEIREGQPAPKTKQALFGFYFPNLLSFSPPMVEIDRANKKSGKRSFVDESVLPEIEIGEPEWISRMRLSDEHSLRNVPRISYLNSEDLTPLVFEFLTRGVKLLERSKANSKEQMYKRKMDYYLTPLKEVLDTQKK